MDFTGIYTALATPYDKDMQVNLCALEKLIEKNLEMGVSGFFVCGSSAEAFLLSVEERKAIMQTVKECVGKRVPLIAHIGAISTAFTAELGKKAKELGYDAVSSVAPFYHKFSFAEIKKYFEVVAAESELPMFIYNIPAFTGVQFTIEQLLELLSIKNVIGIKHTSGDYMQLRQMKTEFPEKIIYNGYDETFLAGLVMGADGAIGSNFNFMADKFIRIRRMFLENKIPEAMRLQDETTRIITIIYKYGLAPSIKAILKAQGIDCGVCRAPFKALTAEEEKSLLAEVLPYLA